MIHHFEGKPNIIAKAVRVATLLIDGARRGARQGASPMSNEISKAADVATLLIDGLDTISRITSSPLVGKAEEALIAVRAVLAAVEKGASGAVTPDAVRAELAALEQAIATNDAKADAALAAKFPHTP